MFVCFVRVKCTLIPSGLYDLVASKSGFAGEVDTGKVAGTCSQDDKEDNDLSYPKRRLRQHSNHCCGPSDDSVSSLPQPWIHPPYFQQLDCFTWMQCGDVHQHFNVLWLRFRHDGQRIIITVAICRSARVSEQVALSLTQSGRQTSGHVK